MRCQPSAPGTVPWPRTWTTAQHASHGNRQTDGGSAWSTCGDCRAAWLVASRTSEFLDHHQPNAAAGRKMKPSTNHAGTTHEHRTNRPLPATVARTACPVLAQLAANAAAPWAVRMQLPSIWSPEDSARRSTERDIRLWANHTKSATSPPSTQRWNASRPAATANARTAAPTLARPPACCPEAARCLGCQERPRIKQPLGRASAPLESLRDLFGRDAPTQRAARAGALAWGAPVSCIAGGPDLGRAGGMRWGCRVCGMDH